ncbi:MAG: indole-3-glycerol phosphate synthase TrpC [Clostridiales bacterium]|nr:indole-3-glycerol phosphate synthase TrpC [Clostridiales bacterium]
MSETILQELAAYAAVRVERDKERIPFSEMKRRALALPRGSFRFENALKEPGLSFICEVKKASPSKGLIAPDFPYLDIARAYEEGGATAVSCLTEPKWFLGSDAIFEEIRGAIGLPMIRKDFTVDAYQIYQARCMGADAVLLICALLEETTVREYLAICDELGLTALVETHNEAEIAMALAAGARVIGVNNRNLKNFTVDFSNAARLRSLIPADRVFAAESGVSSVEDAVSLRAIGADAVLVGEFLMRADDPQELLKELRKNTSQETER